MTIAKKTFAEVLNWYGLVSPGVVLCKDGSFLAGWRLKGLDTESLDRAEVEAKVAALARGVSSFKSGDAFWVDLARRPLRDYRSDEFEFPEEVLRELERERDAWWRSAGSGSFANAITLVFQGQPEDGGDLEKSLGVFEDDCRRVEDRFSALFGMERMRSSRETVGLDGMSFLRDDLVGRLASGVAGRFRQVNIPKIPIFLDVTLTPEWVHEDPLKLPVVSGRPAAFISIDGYPSESAPEMLSMLEMLPLEYQWTTRFMPLSVTRARAEINRRAAAWGMAKSSLKAQMSRQGQGAVSGFATAMEAEAKIAHDEAESGIVRYGFYNTTVSLFGEFGDDEAHIRKIASRLVSALGELGYAARIETYNAFDAFVSTLPGHRRHNVGPALLSAHNFADLIPLRTIWSGDQYCPCDKFPSQAPALVRARSRTGEPYFFNLHVTDVGHSLVLGPSGSGKSVLLALLASSFLKYPGAQVFAFDKIGTMTALAHAAGGKLYKLGDPTSGTGLAPLRAARDFGGDWAERWLTHLIEFDNVTVTPSIRQEIRGALAAALNAPGDVLSTFRNYVQAPAVQAAVDKWIAGGDYDGLFNAEQDGIAFAPFTVFITEQLFEGSQAAALLTLDYLFRAIENRLTGAPTLVLLDEAWAYLGHPIFASRIQNWLRTLRNFNASVVIATQFVKDAAASDLASELLQSCPTRIFLADPGAKSLENRKWYGQLELTDVQIDLLSQMRPKRDYYVVKPEGRRVLDFAIQPKALALLGATDKTASSTAAAMAASGDPDWWKTFIDLRLQRGGNNA